MFLKEKDSVKFKKERCVVTQFDVNGNIKGKFTILIDSIGIVAGVGSKIITIRFPEYDDYIMGYLVSEIDKWFYKT